MSRSFSGGAASAAVMSGFPVRMDEFAAISVQITDAGGTCTISYEVSNDKTTWYPAYGVPATDDGTPVKTSTAVGLFVFPAQGKWFRARVSTYGSGSPDYSAELMSAAPGWRHPPPAA